MAEDDAPVLGAIRTERGVAGQVTYRVSVTYPGEPARESAFTGHVHMRGPVWGELGGLGGMWIREPGRFGDFGPEWVRKFFAAS